MGKKITNMFVPLVASGVGLSRSTSHSTTTSASSSSSSGTEDPVDVNHVEQDDDEAPQTMRRVSSRPRLVSWDAFEANAPAEPTAVVKAPHHHQVVEPDHHDERKRKHSLTSKLLMHMNNSFNSHHHHHSSSSLTSATSATTVEQQASLLAESDDDVLGHVLGFLTPDDARNLLQVNHRCRDVVRSDHVWDDYFRNQLYGKFMKGDQAGATLATSEDDGNSSSLYKLFGMAWKKTQLPSGFDPTLFTATRYRLPTVDAETGLPRYRATHIRKVVSDGGGAGAEKSPQSANASSTAPCLSVQFTGRIGRGDRCVRSDEPFPRPHFVSSKKHLSLRFPWTMRPPKGQPFVAPYLVESQSPVKSWNMQPRWMSYYEVTLSPAAADEDPTERSRRHHRPDHPGRETQQSDCVAVGVCTRTFPLHCRMPGWDNQSYGWHSDDGGLFHGRGNMLRRIGDDGGENENDDNTSSPSSGRYGVNDTVGCGVDYWSRQLFFVKNGRVVGTSELPAAWFVSQENLFPVVGIDTNLIVKINLGLSEPFQFDLRSYERNVIAADSNNNSNSAR